jgi:hypothetical protein
MTRLIFFAASLAAVYLMLQVFGDIHHPPGVLISKEPEQLSYKVKSPIFELGAWKLEPLAHFKTEARVLVIKEYDSYPIDELAPFDFLLGWGLMSDSAIIDQLDLKIANRFGSWRWWGEAPAKLEEISHHAANTHLIPANESIREQLATVRVGDLITLWGELVVVRDQSGRECFRSSLSRTDGGPGACEVVHVTSIQVR